MQWPLYLLAVLAGISNPLQSGSNSALQKGLDAPVVSALLVYAIGTVCLIACVPFLGFPVREAAGRFGRLPWWVFLGGACNALFLVSTLLVTKRLGSATFTTVVVIAAVMTSLLLDHFGLLGFAVRQATPLRLVGGAVAVVGVVMVALL